MTNTKHTCLSCGVFKKEIEALVKQGRLACNIITLDSMLHLNPEKLEQVIYRVIKSRPVDEYTLLLFGDCHPHMHELQEHEHMSKVSGINCCEILLGHKEYRKLQKERAFIFLPEWTLRWQEVFIRELGFSKPEIAQVFMKEHCTRLVYIDTGVIGVPEKALQEISDYFDMPVDVMPISLDVFLEGINKAQQKFKGGDKLGE